MGVVVVEEEEEEEEVVVVVVVEVEGIKKVVQGIFHSPRNRRTCCSAGR